MQQRRQPVERPGGVGAGRFERDAQAAVKIGGEHFHDAVGGKRGVVFVNENVAVEALHRAHELRRRPRVQAEFV